MTSRTPPQLWHYTCSHKVDAINADGHVKPGVTGLAWFTDLHPPRRHALGLTSTTLNCDRMEHEFQVADPSAVIRWGAIRSHFDQKVVDSLELATGAEPRHWWVARIPVAVLTPGTARKGAHPW